MTQKIKPKPILHIIARDLETERHIINELSKRRKEDSTFLEDYYVVCSYKGECKVEVLNGELETMEMDDAYVPDEECIDNLIEPDAFDRFIDKVEYYIRKLLRLNK